MIEQPTGIEANYSLIVKDLPPDVQLVAVSKTYNAETVARIYNVGQRVFGENKVQELVEKYTALPKDIHWHLIGHLQTNKVKYIAEFIDTIQSVDSRKILKEIDKQAGKHNRKIKVLLQVKIAEEDTKYGLESSEAKEIFTEYLNDIYPNVEVQGLMGMATFTDNEKQVQNEFSSLKNLFDELAAQKPLTVLSMGMSNDYKLAIDCGATSVRIGSAIFGSRATEN
jgi:pyridoxal phosphate enzyme (YggS family)